ncbi:MAG: YraN family protein [Candidatus Omnitrophica bacterium]|nr:YraN family protein [Candidatus Omnitrophota bacterium]
MRALSPSGAQGQAAETLACRYLERQGYVIERTNVRYPVGELDVIAWEGPALCFIEVRSRSSTQWGGALASVTAAKRRRVIRAAQWYLQSLRAWPQQVRFDVVAVDWREDGAHQVGLVRGAFESDAW